MPWKGEEPLVGAAACRNDVVPRGCGHVAQSCRGSAHGDIVAVGLDRWNNLSCGRTDEQEGRDHDGLPIARHCCLESNERPFRSKFSDSATR